jgi:F-type H+-transporting ATPase subunit a
MAPIKTSLLLLNILILSLSTVVAAPGDGDNKQVDVLDKLTNHYYLDFKPVGKVELPRIFWDADGVSVYGSSTSALKSGKYVDSYYVDNGLLEEAYPVSYYLVRADGTETKADFSLSSHLVYFWFAGFLLLALAVPLTRRYRSGVGTDSEPKGTFQNMMEVFIIFVRDEIALANIGPKKYLRFTPYLITAFFMILFMNMFGLMPWGVSSTADVTVTAALAVVTFLITQFNGSKDHWKHVFWFPGVPAWIRFILTPVEIIGLFTKPFALCIRLFANMASGKVLIYSIIGLIFIFSGLFGDGVAWGTSWIWVLFALFIYIIKTVVAFLQAYIFTMLSALFIGMAVAEHDHEHEHEHDEDHAHPTGLELVKEYEQVQGAVAANAHS